MSKKKETKKKRYPAEKEARRKASRDFYANEIAWGLNIAINLGLNAQQALEMIAEDFDTWSSYVDWETYD